MGKACASQIKASSSFILRFNLFRPSPVILGEIWPVGSKVKISRVAMRIRYYYSK